MDQFDQLIKEKAEKKEFKYKPLFWLKFAKSAGITTYSAIQVITGIVVITGVIGGTTYFGVKNYQKNHPIKNPKNIIDTTTFETQNEPAPNTITIDTFKVDNNTNIVEPNKPKTSQKGINSLQTNQSSSPTKVIKDSVPTKKTNRDPYVGRRILTIDPDTILTND